MIGDPVQRGIGEHEIEGVPRGEVGDVSPLEAQAGAGVGRAALEHRRRAVETQGLARTETPVQRQGQLARAAAEIDGAHVGLRLHQVEQIEERLLALGAKALVLRRAPGVGHDGRLPPRAHRCHAWRDPAALQPSDVRDTRVRRE